MKRRKWVLIFLVAVVVVYFFKVDKFNDYTSTIEKQYKNDLKITKRFEELSELQNKYHSKILTDLSKYKNEDKSFHYDSRELEKFFEKLSRMTKRRKDELCHSFFEDFQAYIITENNMTSLYRYEFTLRENNCTETKDLENMIEDKLQKYAKNIEQDYKEHNISQAKTINDLLDIQYAYTEDINKLISQLSQRDKHILERYMDSMNSTIEKKIRDRVCQKSKKEIENSYQVLQDKASIDQIEETDIPIIISQVDMHYTQWKDNNCSAMMTSNELQHQYSSILSILREHALEIFLKTYELEFDKLKTTTMAILNNKKREFYQEVDAIAEEYGQEITGFHPIDSDKEVAKKFLIEPFRQKMKELFLNIERNINNIMLDFIKNIYDRLDAYCERNGFNCDKEDTLISSFEPYEVLNVSIEIKNNYREEGVFGDTVDHIIDLTVWPGIIKDAGEGLLNVEFLKSAKSNELKAKKDLQKKIDIIIQSIKKGVSEYQEHWRIKIQSEIEQVM